MFECAARMNYGWMTKKHFHSKKYHVCVAEGVHGSFFPGKPILMTPILPYPGIPETPPSNGAVSVVHSVARPGAKPHVPLQ